jgi:hypothetical protein
MSQTESVMYMGRNAWSMAVLALLLGAAAPAHAQGQPSPQPAAGQGAQGSTEEDFPWGQGVSDADRDRAIAIFLAANVLLEDTLFARAAAGYEEALAIWDHPAFRYNLALARIHLDQPIAAYESLELAVRHGPEPLSSQDRYDHALRYLELLRNQLAHVEVTCDEPGATVTLDGKPLCSRDRAGIRAWCCPAAIRSWPARPVAFRPPSSSCWRRASRPRSRWCCARPSAP